MLEEGLLRFQSVPIYIRGIALLLAGILLGSILPKNESLPSPVVQYASSIVGYTYFLCWSTSFYPQIILNYTRKSTSGLSVDFSILNVVGFGCYSIYVGYFFFSPSIRKQYASRFGGSSDADVDVNEEIDNGVQSNDVAFAFHAFLLSSLQMWQILYYGNRGGSSTSLTRRSRWSTIMRGGSLGLSLWTCLFLIGCTITSIIYGFLMLIGFRGWHLQGLDYLYMLSTIKLVITIIKYIPQVILNHRRKSTVGWNIWNVMLDFTGGLLSLAQLLMDAMDMHDYTAITGNFAKLGLSFVSIFFDIVFLIQHFVLYPSGEGDGNSEQYSLLLTDEA
jgi:cystinosin